MNRTAVVCTSIATLGLLTAVIAGALGPLNPPAGAVTGTSRTLQEIYDKIPAVGSGDGRTPIPGGAGIVITQPGSYVLTGNINATGIGINVNNPGGPVTIDLNGFRVSTTSLTSSCVASINCPQFVIRNGGISGGLNGISISSSPGALVEDVRVSGAKQIGITFSTAANNGATVRRCTVVDTGITTVAADTNAVTGIGLTAGIIGGRVEDCTVVRLIHNGTAPGSFFGITNASTGGLIARCVVSNNAIIAGSIGINAGTSAVYTGNHAFNFPGATEYTGGIDGGGNF